MFVTDTHPLIWSSNRKFSLLSKKVLRAFERANDGEIVIYVPSVVFWKAAMLEKNGKIKLDGGFEKWAKNLLSKSGFLLTELEPAIISRSVGYNFNEDLFDKAIVATAVELDFPLITKDVAITESNLVVVYW